MGYHSDSKGIINRYIREEGRWNTHIDNCKKSIITSADNKQKGTVYVLGSGWLLDVPIQFLLDNFDKIYLVDIIHPLQVVNKYKSIDKVTFIKEDITGGLIKEIYQHFSQKRAIKTDLMSLTYQKYEFSEPPDFVISINILSQMDNLIREYLERFSLYSEEEFKAFGEKIQETHLNTLPKGKTCLITDYEEFLLDDKNNIHSKKQLIHANLSAGIIKQKWQWDFDSSKMYNVKFNVKLNVMSMEI